jgi:hypothetical protein
VLVLSLRVRAVTVCLPVATRYLARNLPTRPPACQKLVEMEREERGSDADDGNVLNSVGEARGLVLGVLLGHVDESGFASNTIILRMEFELRMICEGSVSLYCFLLQLISL